LASEEDQLSDLRRLQSLVAYPREGLDVELKGWLDLADGEQAASLLKAIVWASARAASSCAGAR
jgi:hypothetical protein